MAVSARVLIASALALSGCNVVFGVDEPVVDAGDGANLQCTPDVVREGLSVWYPLKAVDAGKVRACVGAAGTCEPATCPDQDKDGVYGSALRFSAGHYISAPSPQVMRSTTADLTVAFWMRLDRAPGDVCPVRDLMGDGTTHAWSLCLRGNVDGTATATARWADSVTHTYVEIVRAGIAPGAWMHVVMRSSGQKVQLLVDGTGVDTAAIGGLVREGDELRLGSDADGTQQTAFDGALADLRVYGRTLTDTEIEQLGVRISPQPL